MTSESNKPDRSDAVTKLVQTLSVVIGVVLSIFSFNQARNNEAAARKAEAVRPFLEMRQKVYADAVHTAAMMANLKEYTEEEAKLARRRFRELYVTELSLVESKSVEKGMISLAKAADPDLLDFTAAQNAAYELSHALRDSLLSQKE